jgi:EAL domain-containing protein (putative c-di-GMP-specific phosphodiesterase class I)
VPLRGDRATKHYELLMRVVGEYGTHLSPAAFMSAATRYRMLPALDRAVLKHVFGKLQKHRAALMQEKLRFSVNLSGPSIGDPEFLEWVAACSSRWMTSARASARSRISNSST